MNTSLGLQSGKSRRHKQRDLTAGGIRGREGGKGGNRKKEQLIFGCKRPTQHRSTGKKGKKQSWGQAVVKKEAKEEEMKGGSLNLIEWEKGKRTKVWKERRGKRGTRQAGPQSLSKGPRNTQKGRAKKKNRGKVGNPFKRRRG